LLSFGLRFSSFRFLLGLKRFRFQTLGFSFGRLGLSARVLGLLARSFGISTALRFSSSISGGLRGALLSSLLIGGSYGLCIFLGFLLHGHHARFLRSVYSLASQALDGRFIALLYVSFFRLTKLLVGLGNDGAGVFI
jgi:hypothetical protein